MSSDFFCPAPWRGLYQHNNNASPCHTNRNHLGLSPKEYLNSDFLKSLKEDFMEGIVPPSCYICYERESLGIKSTRQSVLTKHLGSKELYKREDFSVEQKTSISRLELRTSNLCNFKCRMCDASSSSEIAREYMEINKDESIKENGYIFSSDDKVIQELKDLTLDSVRLLCLTGGEPLLNKQYYEFLDLLIEKELTKNITIELFTNCSVYNPLFIERLNKFHKVRFIMSIDGVGKTAEYQRKGTVWKTVEQNIYKFVVMPKPFEICYNTAISPYVLLDVSSLAKFLMKLYEMNGEIGTRCYSTIKPDPLNFMNMDKETRKRSVEQIDKACEILTVDNFFILKKELLNIKRNLVEKEPVEPELFIKYTERMDRIRNEKFEDVFGYKLTPP